MVLTIFHYHLQKGGVTDVIYKSVVVLLEQEILSRINLLSSAPPQDDHPLAKLINDDTISLHIIDALNYIEKIPLNTNVEAELKTCFDKFRDEQAIWWVHNHHLGKNPLFTRCLMDFLHISTQPALLQIHDFPEAARFENLWMLQEELALSLCYSNSPTTEFVTINSHDHDILNSAGIQNTLLYNVIPERAPLSVTANEPNVPPTQATHIKETLLEHFPDYVKNTSSADYLLFTYPVRSIRRKNVLEAALITKLYESYFKLPSLFCITLPATSDPEMPYFTQVESLFQDGFIEGFCGIGNALDDIGLDFHDLCRQSDLIISSSVQEGFGFSFFQTVDWVVPLLARQIYVHGDIAPVFESDNPLDNWPSHWYEGLHIPFEILDEITSHSDVPIRDLLYTHYKDKIYSLSSLYTNDILDALSHNLEKMCSSDTIDFSFLTVSQQVVILRNFHSCAELICKENLSILRHIQKLLEYSKRSMLNIAPKVHARISQKFGKDAFLQNFLAACMRAKEGKAKTVKDPTKSAEKILLSFASMDYLRSLFE